MKTLTIFAGLNHYRPNATADEVIEQDYLEGFYGSCYHYIIERNGKTRWGQSHHRPSVRSYLNVSRDTISVLLLGGWGPRGPVDAFDDSQVQSFLKLYKDLYLEKVVDRVAVHTLVPSTGEVACWLNLLDTPAVLTVGPLMQEPSMTTAPSIVISADTTPRGTENAQSS